MNKEYCKNCGRKNAGMHTCTPKDVFEQKMFSEDHVADATKMVASVRENRTVEPVAYVTGYSKGYATVKPVDPCLLMCVGMALYRSLPKREPLTDEEIDALDLPPSGTATVRDLVRLIERAHGIGGEE